MTIEKTRMTQAEFALLPETNVPTELIDGEVIVSPAPKDAHQAFIVDLLVYLGGLVKAGGELRTTPSDVYLGEHVVQPDIFWVRQDSDQCVLGDDGYWHGAPDLIIEVLSPGTSARDRGRKFEIYQQHGVREYWIVEPEAKFIEVYTRTGDRFERGGVFTEGAFDSAVLGQKIEIGAIITG